MEQFKKISYETLRKISRSSAEKLLKLLDKGSIILILERDRETDRARDDNKVL